jgi:ferredoxin--NADP+ reductase
VASNFLCDAKPGDPVTISGPYRSPFEIPADDSCNLLMIGVGTGIAPFRAIIQHIYDQRGGWHGQVRLFYGAATGLDLYYLNDENDDLTNYFDQKTFRAIEAVAGRPLMGADEALARGLEENAAAVWELMQDPKTYVFVAGLTNIADSMDAAMSRIAGSEETWQETKRELKEVHRWSELLYS